MNKYYTIIIPIFNESSKIPKLIIGLEKYYNQGHEIIIIDDGSNDNSFKILLQFKFLKLLRLEKNEGKGAALKMGLKNAKNEKIVIFDGDLELNPSEITKLMILENNTNGVSCVFGTRYEKINLFSSLWDFGNSVLTELFNFKYKSNLKDALCCAKSFFKSNLIIKNLKSKKFDIDVEIASHLIAKHKSIKTIKLEYDRRYKNEGKKLSYRDSFLIIKRILGK